MDPLDMPACAVSIESGYAVSVAHRYVELVEAQLSQAQSDLHSAALDAYERMADHDEADYDCSVRVVESSFEEDYRPILRSTEVIYLHMIFETYVCRHIAEVEKLKGRAPGIVKKLKKQHECGTATAAKIYFRKSVRWSVLDNDDWVALCEIAALRNCVVHNGGVVRGTKHAEDVYHLERSQKIGIKIIRYEDGRDAGQPVMIHQPLIQYYLSLLKKLFDALGEKTYAEFWSKRPGRT